MNTPSSSDSSPTPPPSSGWTKALRELAPYLDLGWRIALGLGVFIGGGYGLDRWWGTLPWFTVVGAVFGMVGVFVQIYRVSEQLGQRANTTSSHRPGRSEDNTS